MVESMVKVVRVSIGKMLKGTKARAKGRATRALPKVARIRARAMTSPKERVLGAKVVARISVRRVFAIIVISRGISREIAGKQNGME